MKKLSIFSLLLVLLCVPVLSSCSKKITCEYCRWYEPSTATHLILSLGLKGQSPKTYDLSTDKVKATLQFHVHDAYPQPHRHVPIQEYGTGKTEQFAFVFDYDKVNEQGMSKGRGYPLYAFSVEELIEMSFRDNYEKKVKPEDGATGKNEVGVVKWYTKEFEIRPGYFLEGKHYFYVATYYGESWYKKVGFEEFYYIREKNKLEIGRIPENELLVDRLGNFNEEAFWVGFLLTPDWILP